MFKNGDKKSLKIKDKSKKIRQSRNRVKLNEDDWIHAFKTHCISEYRIISSELALFSTKLSNWRIEHDGCIITLWHESKDLAPHGNDRASYHIQNVYYDIDYCIKSALEHDDYEIRVRYG